MNTTFMDKTQLLLNNIDDVMNLRFSMPNVKFSKNLGMVCAMEFEENKLLGIWYFDSDIALDKRYRDNKEFSIKITGSELYIGVGVSGTEEHKLSYPLIEEEYFERTLVSDLMIDIKHVKEILKVLETSPVSIKAELYDL